MKKKIYVYSGYCFNANGLSKTLMIFVHNSLSVNDASTLGDFYDACGWSESQPKQDHSELETEHFQCGLKLMSQ